jgi:uncharacterized protein (TIGR02145 family)
MRKNFWFYKFLFLMMVVFFSDVISLEAQKQNLLKDSEGNSYKTITIGDQVWMAENLRTTKFNDGTDILNETNATKWVKEMTPAFCWLDNDKDKSRVYGAMYNWHAVNTGKLCPVGWKIPSDEDWNKLIDFLGGVEVAGGKLKENGTSKWISPNSEATNSAGFAALPAGYRYGYFWGSGIFYELGLNGYFWTSTEYTETFSWSRTLSAKNGKVYRSVFEKNNGFSIRCIKDSNYKK